MQSGHEEAFMSPSQGSDVPALLSAPIVVALEPPDTSKLPTAHEVGVLCVVKVKDLLEGRKARDVRVSDKHEHKTRLLPLCPPTGEVPEDWTKYLREVLRVSGIAGYLTPILEQCASHNFCMHVHYYYNRPLTTQGPHHDTIGRTLFVGLHYLVQQPILGAEWTFHWHEFSGRKSPLDQSLNVWPPKIREDVARAREVAQQSIRKKWHVARIPANGLLFFTDELVHHKTPSRSRKSLEEGGRKTVNDALGRVQIFDAEDLQVHSFAHDTTDYERDVSDDEDEDLGRAKGNTFDDPGNKRTFIRFWITVQPIGETIYW